MMLWPSLTWDHGNSGGLETEGELTRAEESTKGGLGEDGCHAQACLLCRFITEHIVFFVVCKSREGRRIKGTHRANCDVTESHGTFPQIINLTFLWCSLLRKETQLLFHLPFLCFQVHAYVIVSTKCSFSIMRIFLA